MTLKLARVVRRGTGAELLRHDGAHVLEGRIRGVKGLQPRVGVLVAKGANEDVRIERILPARSCHARTLAVERRVDLDAEHGRRPVHQLFAEHDHVQRHLNGGRIGGRAECAARRRDLAGLQAVAFGDLRFADPVRLRVFFGHGRTQCKYVTIKCMYTCQETQPRSCPREARHPLRRRRASPSSAARPSYRCPSPAKSMYPLSGSVDTNFTRTLSPTSNPAWLLTTIPSAGGLIVRTNVPF